MVNYFNVAMMTLYNTNCEPKDNLNDIASSSSSTHTIRQTPTIPGVIVGYVELMV